MDNPIAVGDHPSTIDLNEAFSDDDMPIGAKRMEQPDV
jgi:hypothetical protein